jgi:hypothetical protein
MSLILRCLICLGRLLLPFLLSGTTGLLRFFALLPVLLDLSDAAQND